MKKLDRIQGFSWLSWNWRAPQGLFPLLLFLLLPLQHLNAAEEPYNSHIRGLTLSGDPGLITIITSGTFEKEKAFVGFSGRQSSRQAQIGTTTVHFEKFEKWGAVNIPVISHLAFTLKNLSFRRTSSPPFDDLNVDKQVLGMGLVFSDVVRGSTYGFSYAPLSVKTQNSMDLSQIEQFRSVFMGSSERFGKHFIGHLNLKVVFPRTEELTLPSQLKITTGQKNFLIAALGLEPFTSGNLSWFLETRFFRFSDVSAANTDSFECNAGIRFHRRNMAFQCGLVGFDQKPSVYYGFNFSI